MSAECKYCGVPMGELTCGGVAIPETSPLNRALVCADCAEDDWMRDADMEDR